ncbi:LOW QUALITY PROTEIN: F-box/WD repeat-containing protein 12 [Macaca thibetana thibetana]|uniref:LOW QUALITY PROTEIN: F-box/WD repeat-containing protein 12 n=1 Tax=Macaca thibetana thibetana TaxID=257877 RepID=UPI0021BC3B20|nr:LOW QUALITY PROTEIN: F-box/WD repeat-containing protein 12 [Macaca thibetana thibetana]
MEIQLPDLALKQIFSFLDLFGLLQASQVNKHWNRIAESDFLWRSLSLQRWDCSNFTNQHLGTHTWKKFFLHQRRKELRLALAQPHNFIYKVTKNIAYDMELAYLSGNSLTMDEQEKSIICGVSPKQELCAWDVQEGTMIWSSPVQEFYFLNLVTLPQMHLAITMDRKKTIKVWNCQDRDALAILRMPESCYGMEAYLTKDGPFLTVGDAAGNIYTFTLPGLRDVSEVTASQYGIVFLHCSPDKKWIFACGTYRRTLPQTISQGESIVMIRKQCSLKQQHPVDVANVNENSFMKPEFAKEMEEGSDFDSLATHSGYPWKDPRYVLTTSKNSVHVYMWEEGGRHPYLRSCYRLENIWHDPTTDDCISSVMCDNASIVLTVTVSEYSMLVMYSLNM